MKQPQTCIKEVSKDDLVREASSSISIALCDNANPNANPKIVSATSPQDKEPGELIRGVVEVRSKLDKIRKGREGRGRWVGVLLGNDTNGVAETTNGSEQPSSKEKPKEVKKAKDEETHTLVEMDHRVGQLEKMIVASSASLDEVLFSLSICSSHHIIKCNP